MRTAPRILRALRPSRGRSLHGDAPRRRDPAAMALAGRPRGWRPISCPARARASGDPTSQGRRGAGRRAVADAGLGLAIAFFTCHHHPVRLGPAVGACGGGAVRHAATSPRSPARGRARLPDAGSGVIARTRRTTTLVAPTSARTPPRPSRRTAFSRSSRSATARAADRAARRATRQPARAPPAAGLFLRLRPPGPARLAPRVRRGEPGLRRVEDGRRAARRSRAQRRVRVLRARVPVPLGGGHDGTRARRSGARHAARRAARQRPPTSGRLRGPAQRLRRRGLTNTRRSASRARRSTVPRSRR